MIFFVAPGKSLSFFLHTTAPADTVVTFKKKAGGDEIAKLTVPKANFTITSQSADPSKQVASGRYKWTAPALPEGVSELDVLMVHDKQAADAQPVPIKIYRDQLKVKVTQAGADGAQVACGGVRVRLTVEASAEWLAYKRAPPMGAVLKDTDPDGIATFDNVPYGVAKAEILKPAVMSGAWTKTPDLWTAQVAPGYRVVLVSPVALADSAEAHKQYVNLDAASSREINDPLVGDGSSYGSTVTIKAKLAEGVRPAGQTIWFCAVFSPTNSPRSGPPRPALDGAIATRGTPLIRTAVVNGDGLATLPLELGPAGGDEVSIYVAGHSTVSPSSFDAKTRLVSWRRLELRIVKLATSDADKNALLTASNPTAVLDDEVQHRVADELGKAFIEVLWKPSDFVGQAEPKNLEFTTGAAAEASLNLDPNRQHTLWQDIGMPPNKGATKPPPGRFTPPRISIHVVDKLITRTAESATFTLNVKPADLRKGVPIPAPAGSYLLRDWTAGRSVFLEVERGKKSYWTADGGTTTTDLVDADLFIAGGALSGPDAFIKLSEKKLQTIPATATITLVAKVQNYAGKVGDSADRCLAIAAGVKPVATESVQTRRARLSYALLHEIGHGLKLAAKDARIKELDGRDKNPLLYEYDGPHCAAGIPDSARTKDPPYVGADKKLLVGACVLYSPTSPGTPYGQVNKYCPDCLTHLKGMQLGIFRPPGGGTPVSDFPGVDRVTRY